MKIEERAITEAISQLVRTDQCMVSAPLHHIRRAAVRLVCNNNNTTMKPAIRRNFNIFHEGFKPWAPHGIEATNMERRKIIGAPELTKRNFKTIIASTELVMVFFYVRRDRFCKFSMLLFDEAADDVRNQYPNEKLVMLGKVDCDKEGSIEQDYHITSYPTIKIFRNGEPLRGKYKGALLPVVLKSYIMAELDNPIKRFHEPKELINVNNERKIIVGYFENEDTIEYDNFRRIAQTLKKFGNFYARFGDKSDTTNSPNEFVISYTPECTSLCDTEETFKGYAKNYDELNIWAHKMFMVQEMVFDNFQKLIEDCYPLLILYYDPNHCACVREFKDIVANTMMNRKHNVNFAVANGLEFTDCIEKYGKETTDLPLVAIESPKHVFLYPHSIDITFREKLKDFVHDFDIGKLQYIARTGGEWTKRVALMQSTRNNLDFD